MREESHTTSRSNCQMRIVYMQLQIYVLHGYLKLASIESECSELHLSGNEMCSRSCASLEYLAVRNVSENDFEKQTTCTMTLIFGFFLILYQVTMFKVQILGSSIAFCLSWYQARQRCHYWRTLVKTEIFKPCNSFRPNRDVPASWKAYCCARAMQYYVPEPYHEVN